MIDEVRARLRPRVAVAAAVLALAGTVLTVQGARQEAAADAAEAARAHATGFPEEPSAVPSESSAPPAEAGAAEGIDTVIPAPTSSAGPSIPAPPASRRLGGDPRWTVLPRSVPEAVEIPSIGVRSALIPLGLRPDGTVEVPPLTGSAPPGWYRHSVTPGEAGPAVLLGHVDSAQTGKGVFYRLTDLDRGAEIRVTRRDGTTAVFTVTSMQRYAKSAFPTEHVYGPTDAPTLRLVTCGGVYDPVAQTFVDNIVVYATAQPAPATGNPDSEADGRPVH
ncbi:sortase (surface protein transpeptidase) [Catenuloplanes nepalensis]|uniref:Sortase (Surface protein transpeptidase) n=1 Tax=Catenuloplanes nepalensis TaxID=587533 RepID=A0ABT9MTL0_9ACTN|nr:class F sortase [Catenuloplanes nepalensis]MDP9794772.1 sortase (surface protein transpeptidase) [Catenuloplanes nepalensis]